MIPKNYEYVNGSTARKLEYDVYQENSVLKEKKKYRNSRIVKFKLVLSILAVLAAGLFVTYRFAAITQMSYNISQTEAKYYELRNDNSRLRMQIEKDTDLNSIKLSAEKRLGMQMPDKSQMVYVNVPKSDYTVVMSTGADMEKGEGNPFTVFMNKMAGLVSLLE